VGILSCKLPTTNCWPRRPSRTAVAVYLGDKPQHDGGVHVLPAAKFARQLGDLLA
jgi:hypothetical protein